MFHLNSPVLFLYILYKFVYIKANYVSIYTVILSFYCPLANISAHTCYERVDKDVSAK